MALKKATYIDFTHLIKTLTKELNNKIKLVKGINKYNISPHDIDKYRFVKYRIRSISIRYISFNNKTNTVGYYIGELRRDD